MYCFLCYSETRNTHDSILRPHPQGSAQDLILAVCSKIAPGRTLRPYWVLRIEPRLATFNTSTLLAILSFNLCGKLSSYTVVRKHGVISSVIFYFLLLLGKFYYFLFYASQNFVFIVDITC